MNTERVVKTFTDTLYELFVEQKVPLKKALEIIAFEKKTGLQKGADSILKAMLSGVSFSNALKSCEYINFDPVYVSFVAFSEITGDLKDTLEFLKNRCQRRENNNTKLLEASMYPAFIVVLAVAVCVFLYFYGNSLGLGSGRTNSLEQFSQLFLSISLLLVVCCFVFFVIRKNLQENKLYEAFLAVGFLIKSGVNVSTAVSAGVIIAGPGSKYGALFQKAKERLEFGVDIYTAFDNFELSSDLRNSFYYAHMAGNKAEVFEKIALRMGADDEKRRRRCLSLVEPTFIGITGLFLITLLVSYLLPMMSDTSWLN